MLRCYAYFGVLLLISLTGCVKTNLDPFAGEYIVGTFYTEGERFQLRTATYVAVESQFHPLDEQIAVYDNLVWVKSKNGYYSVLDWTRGPMAVEGDLEIPIGAQAGYHQWSGRKIVIQVDRYGQLAWMLNDEQIKQQLRKGFRDRWDALPGYEKDPKLYREFQSALNKMLNDPHLRHGVVLSDIAGYLFVNGKTIHLGEEVVNKLGKDRSRGSTRIKGTETWTASANEESEDCINIQCIIKLDSDDLSRSQKEIFGNMLEGAGPDDSLANPDFRPTSGQKNSFQKYEYKYDFKKRRVLFAKQATYIDTGNMQLIMAVTWELVGRKLPPEKAD